MLELLDLRATHFLDSKPKKSSSTKKTKVEEAAEVAVEVEVAEAAVVAPEVEEVVPEKVVLERVAKAEVVKGT